MIFSQTKKFFMKPEKKDSFTLIEVLVGVGLMLIIFLGVFGAYQLGLKVVGLFERKVTASQIAQGEIEKIKNMPYLEVGLINAQGDEAIGVLERTTTTVLNGVEYKIERKIIKISDESDGVEESCPVDYKKAEIKVSFSGIFKSEVVLTTDIIPKDIIEELKLCEENPTGILSVQVFNAKGESVSSPLIEVFNAETGQLESSKIPSEGKYNFPLTPQNYKIVVSRSGYSTEMTYGINEVAIPEKPNPIVLEGQITPVSLAIDKISSMSIKTLSNYGQEFFFDSFFDENKISEKENVLISNGQATLATTSQGYLSSGRLISIEIFPLNLIEWQEFSFTDEEPTDTDLKYQIYYASGTEWVLIPDSDLLGNSTGFDHSPVNLSSLATTTYQKLKIKANFSTDYASSTPILKDWQISWKSSLSIPIDNVIFNLRGDKIIGKDSSENPIYKYSTTTTSDFKGEKNLQNLEWDIYYFSNFQKDSQNLDLATSTPEHPVSLGPNENLEVKIYLESQNSLLLTVKDLVSLEPIFSATTTLSATGFEKTQYTDQNGQTIFIPLEEKIYSLSVESPGYFSTSTTIYVSGKTTKFIKLSSPE